MTAEREVNYRLRRIAGRAIVLVFLGILGITLVFPLYILVVHSLHPDLIRLPYPITLVPGKFGLKNYVDLFQTQNIGRWLLNSLIVAGGTSTLQIAICSLAAFGFARTEFRFRNLIFATLMIMLVIPIQTRVLPIFLLMSRLRLLDTYLVWIPFISEAFGVFLFRQYMLSIPRDFDESAYIDGAGQFRVYLNIIMPLMGPAIIVVFTFNFITQWNDFLYPLVVINKNTMYTVQLGLANLFTNATEAGPTMQNIAPALAGSTVGMLPTLVIYLAFQRRIIEGTLRFAGLKG